MTRELQKSYESSPIGIILKMSMLISKHPAQEDLSNVKVPGLN